MSELKNFLRRQSLIAAIEELTEIQPESMAAAANVDKKPEDEIVFYAQIGDWLGLDHADSKEAHEQWEIKIHSDSKAKRKVRVRQTTRMTHVETDPVTTEAKPVVTWTFTAKTKYDTGSQVTGNMEENVEVNESLFQVFKRFAEKGMIKNRYTFMAKEVRIRHKGQDVHLPGSTVGFEVDVFPLKGKPGSFAPWVKIDVEVNKIMDKVRELGWNPDDIEFKVDPSKLPFNPTDILQNGTPEADEKIHKLYDDYFLSTPPQDEQALSAEDAAKAQQAEDAEKAAATA